MPRSLVARQRPSEKPARAPKRDVRMPSKYSKDFPISEGSGDYLIRGLPDAIWRRARGRADAEERSLRSVIIRLLEHYGKHGLPND